MSQWRCIFCKGTEKRQSDKDVLPRWMARTFPLGKKTRLVIARGPQPKMAPGTTHRTSDYGFCGFATHANRSGKPSAFRPRQAEHHQTPLSINGCPGLTAWPSKFATGGPRATLIVYASPQWVQ